MPIYDPHVSIDSSDNDVEKLADKVRSRNLVIGSVVAPVWSAIGSDDDRKQFLDQVLKACRIAKKLSELDVRIVNRHF